MRTSPAQSTTRNANLRALAAALLLFALVLGLVNSCGTGDLVFPGNIPDTFTPTTGAASTATPTTIF
jgi:hypothetical protein